MKIVIRVEQLRPPLTNAGQLLLHLDVEGKYTVLSAELDEPVTYVHLTTPPEEED